LVIFSIGLLASPQAFADWDKFSYPQIQGTVPVSSMSGTMSIQNFVDQTQIRHGDPVITKKFFEQRGFDMDAPMVSVSFSKFDREAATDETGFINPMGIDYVKQGDVQIGVEDDIITIERHKYRQLGDCFSIFSCSFNFKDTGVSKYTIEKGKPIYMTGAELYESTGADYTEQKNGVAISVAMAVAENSASLRGIDGKAMYAKLANVNGFLMHEVILITEDRGYYKALVDAGNGEVLYISAAESEKEIKKIVDGLYEMFKEHLPLTLEEKKQKLHEYIQSLN
jgi:uncharacterized membrane protein YkoI